MIDKAVIPAAGLGTRLLPATKEQLKEMLPVYSRGVNGEACLKPVLQLVFEQLYDVGIREFCFVVGRGKRVIEDHFTQDYSYAGYLRGRGRTSAAQDLEAFYQRIDVFYPPTCVPRFCLQSPSRYVSCGAIQQDGDAQR